MTTPEREGRENLPALLPPEPVPLSRDIIKEIAMTGEAKYRVLLRRNADGTERWVDYEYEIEPHDYLWTEGNYGCDCNRHLFFELAGGSEADEDVPCGETLYTAVKAVAPDGAEIPLDDDP